MKRVCSEVFIILGDSEKAETKKAALIAKYGISDFDIKTVYADDKKPGKILEDMDFLPVFSKKKLLHIKNSEKLSKADCEKIEMYFQKPPEHICIMLTGRDIKPPLKGYAERVVEEPKTGLFPQVFRLKKKEDRRKLIALLMEHLNSNERDFTPVVTAAEIYIRNRLVNQKKADSEIIGKFNSLHRLDLHLKTGRYRTGPELEIFLYWLFS